uniref:Uncharacterized protein n=1 Tax=Arundo donax TaxID=35708 RepID=A0A0A9A776_ARUDO
MLMDRKDKNVSCLTLHSLMDRDAKNTELSSLGLMPTSSLLLYVWRLTMSLPRFLRWLLLIVSLAIYAIPAEQSH